MSPFSFDPKTYSELAPLGAALDNFDQGPGQAVLDNEIRSQETSSDLFERTEGAASLFGISLLHRHFDMDDDEVLVEHGSTSTPWKLPQDPTNFMAGRLVPRSWRFEAGNEGAHLQAYEFGFQPHRSDDAAGNPVEAYSHFIQDLSSILANHSLISVLGLMVVPSDYLPSPDHEQIKCERTFGRANVVFDIPPGDLDDKEKRTSIWVYGRPNNVGAEAMLCFSGCLCTRADI
ncbi:hypothetical protein F4680DRAFT_46796 [Xylaria scruposa]|nr:hypothetical protein F4680DRAFT_46796 [Xylaria scruposa]